MYCLLGTPGSRCARTLCVAVRIATLMGRSWGDCWVGVCGDGGSGDGRRVWVLSLGAAVAGVLRVYHCAYCRGKLNINGCYYYHLLKGRSKYMTRFHDAPHLTHPCTSLLSSNGSN